MLRHWITNNLLDEQQNPIKDAKVYLASEVDAHINKLTTEHAWAVDHARRMADTIEAMSLAIGLALGHLNAGDMIVPHDPVHEAFKSLMVRESQ